MKPHILPTALLTLGLAGTGVGLAHQTHQQHLIDQDSRRVVHELAATHTLTRSVVTRLNAITVMNQQLSTINGQIGRVNQNLLGEASQMSQILGGQDAIWSTLASLNRGLAQTNGALGQDKAEVGQTVTEFASPAGLVPVTEEASHLVQELNQSSTETARLLRQMANKMALLGTISRTIP